MPAMPAKTPIYLKSTSSRKGKKCRLRDILSPDMISPPLGDFRHTIHIGTRGERDAFGDMSFLQGKYELLPGKQEKPQCVVLNEPLRAKSTAEGSSFEIPSPVLKNAISLPAIGGSQALNLPLICTMSPPAHHDPFHSVDLPGSSFLEKSNDPEPDALLLSLDVFSPKPAEESSSISDFMSSMLEKQSESLGMRPCENGVAQPRENGFNGASAFHNSSNGIVQRDTGLSGIYSCSSTDEHCQSPYQYKPPKAEFGSQDSISKINGSLLSLELDLGPSILDDVLNIMDRPKTAIKSGN